MSSIEHYCRQYQWRSWPQILDALPDINGQQVSDLGCGVGDIAAKLAARGARVVGVDANEDFIRFAQCRKIPNAEFRVGGLQSFDDAEVKADGIWSSFTAAYFPSFQPVLRRWARHLRNGGWIALTSDAGPHINWVSDYNLRVNRLSGYFVRLSQLRMQFRNRLIFVDSAFRILT